MLLLLNKILKKENEKIDKLVFKIDKKNTDKIIIKYNREKPLLKEHTLYVGLGKVKSGKGDWGWRYSYASEPLISLLIDKEFNIIEYKIGRFYNSSKEEKEKSNEMEKIMKRYIHKYQTKLYVSDFLKKQIKQSFMAIEYLTEIGLIDCLQYDYKNYIFELSYYNNIEEYINSFINLLEDVVYTCIRKKVGEEVYRNWDLETYDKEHEKYMKKLKNIINIIK